MTPLWELHSYWQDVSAHTIIEWAATLLGVGIYKLCPHTWHRRIRLVIALLMDIVFAMVCVRVIG